MGTEQGLRQRGTTHAPSYDLIGTQIRAWYYNNNWHTSCTPTSVHSRYLFPFPSRMGNQQTLSAFGAAGSTGVVCIFRNCFFFACITKSGKGLTIAARRLYIDGTVNSTATSTKRGNRCNECVLSLAQNTTPQDEKEVGTVHRSSEEDETLTIYRSITEYYTCLCVVSCPLLTLEVSI